jgi:hypothetical protein
MPKEPKATTTRPKKPKKPPATDPSTWQELKIQKDTIVELFIYIPIIQYFDRFIYIDNLWECAEIISVEAI